MLFAPDIKTLVFFTTVQIPRRIRTPWTNSNGLHCTQKAASRIAFPVTVVGGWSPTRNCLPPTLFHKFTSTVPTPLLDLRPPRIRLLIQWPLLCILLQLFRMLQK